MKRAILVSSGTLAGLVAVLTYSGGDTLPASAAGAGAAGLGGPPLAFARARRQPLCTCDPFP